MVRVRHRDGRGPPITISEELRHGLEPVGVGFVSHKDANRPGCAEEHATGDRAGGLGRGDVTSETRGGVSFFDRQQACRRRDAESFPACENVVSAPGGAWRTL